MMSNSPRSVFLLTMILSFAFHGQPIPESIAKDFLTGQLYWTGPLQPPPRVNGKRSDKGVLSYRETRFLLTLLKTLTRYF